MLPTRTGADVDRTQPICYRLTAMRFERARRRGAQRLGAAMAFLWGVASPAGGHAIEIQPGPAQIAAALERGKAAAVARIPPDRLYAWFGSVKALEPRGFLMTKLVGLTVMSAHFVLRSETPSEAEIRQILEEKTLLVSVTIFGERPTFAMDSYLVLVQGERTIKPVRIRFDGQASRTSVWPASPGFQAKVVASFSYADLDPRAKTRLSVFPSLGGAVSFDLEFSEID